VIARDILRDSFPVLPPDASLTEALERFNQHDGERLPVCRERDSRCNDRYYGVRKTLPV